MPPRRRSINASLTADDIATLTTALADGKRATVYLREGTPSLSLKPGASARVLSIDGTTLTIKPTGVNDELPYEADELRITKAAPPEPEKPKKAAPVRKPKPASTPVRTPSPAPKPERAVAALRPTPDATGPAAAKKTPSPTPARRTNVKKPPASVTVTLFGSSDNAWSVVVTRGGRKPARSRSVAPDSVESAMQELGDAAALDAASSVLNAAREEAQRRVEQLSRELEAAREALAALDGATD